ncbi:MAG TPA: TIGR01244 family sulfur transferase [Methylibium sp.]|uniref:TIGR01244 family sulfur transferase n=1 Tax=Methylibium sp. TaxID=2067992 RepID=UPI002DBDDE88|nr:TIGR01244 family sulfur transferase [Methylibium sp.]HEU4459871.1 TIGR01244 family sulfur transferase [Methylibium sp.]
MDLPATRLNAEIATAPQLRPEAMAAAAAAGFRSVINNRPDFEGGAEQPTNASIEAAARAAGLEYAFLPVAGGFQTPEQAKAMADLLERLPKPVLAFCRSGARSGKLYELSRSFRG